MQRDRLLLAEVIDAAERLVELTAERTPADFETDRDRRDALLWNFTVLGEAVAQLSEAVKAAHPQVEWSDPVRLRGLCGGASPNELGAGVRHATMRHFYAPHPADDPASTGIGMLEDVHGRPGHQASPTAGGFVVT